MSSLSMEEENYVRLTLLLKGVTPRAVRTYFDREFPPICLSSTLSKCHYTLIDLKGKRIINQAQWNLLKPRNGVPDSTTFDVKLMICLIRNLTSINPPINGFDSLPLPGETTPGSDLARIKYYRNILANRDSSTIDTAYFNAVWRDISDAVCRLGGQTMYEECQKLKVKIVDQSDQENLLEIKQSMEEMKELRQTIDILGQEHSKVTQTLRELQTFHTSLQTEHSVVVKDLLGLKAVHLQLNVDQNPRNINMIKDDNVPTEIKLMADERSVPLYLKLLESGSEKKRDIRLVIVGKKGAGKTSMIKRLFSADNSYVTSTNGIEIHTIKCNAMSDDGIWKKLDGHSAETEINSRLMKQYISTIEASIEEGTYNSLKESTSETSLNESMESETSSQKLQPSVATECTVQPPVTTQQHDQSTEQAKRDIKSLLKSDVDLNDKVDYATIMVWDFAGDEDFYHTHQTFLSPDAIYLVVTKLNEADIKEAQDLFRLWMDSIHCYSRLEEDKNKSDDHKATTDELDPPVVIIGTWKDALTEVDEMEDACRENLYKYMENMSDDELRHIRQDFIISNTKDDHNVFQEIRKYILNIARTMKTWEQDYPIKFIQLENRLQEKKKELPIISFQEIRNIAIDIPKPLNEEELRLFLEFHHEIRSLVYFKDLPSYIILDTQWLSDAFKCIVTAKKFRAITFKNKNKWDELYSKGKLHSEVLEDIFKKNHVFSKHKDHILKVMEKFDIIVCPDISESANEKPCYYVPCLIQSQYQGDIYELFNVTEDTCQRSTWLCFKFSFQPPHLMNHLIASLSRKYEVAEVVVHAPSNEKKKPLALFRSTAVFELQKKTKLSKLLVMTFPHFIQVQVLEYAKSAYLKRGLYRDVGDFVTDELEKIIHTRFKMSNVQFEKKFECGLTKPESVTGFCDLNKEEITEYLCGTCRVPHTFIGEWSEQKNEALCKMDRYEKKPQQKGLVMIVNFMFSRTPKERKGSDLDVNNLTVFFRDELGYQVECRSDMTKKEFQNYLDSFEKSYLTKNSSDYHSFICVIMSHGDENGIQTMDEQMEKEPKENHRITVNEIQRHFKNKPDGKFNGKPKVFLIQACRGHLEQEKVCVSDILKNETKLSKHETEKEDEQSGSSEDVHCTDATDNSLKLPTDADIIVAYATTPDYISIRNSNEGANFIRAFLSVAKKHYKEEDIEEILRRVRNELATNPEFEPAFGLLAGKCQMGISESTSTKKFFL